MNRHRLLARAIGLSVPILNLFRSPDEWPYSLDGLSDMPDGSWGRELYSFLESRELGYLPKYEEHDAYHALLGYGTTVTEELKLQAFMFGNGSATIAGRVLLTIGVVGFPAKWRLLREEFRRGRRSSPLHRFPTTVMMPLPLNVVRRKMCIV